MDFWTLSPETAHQVTWLLGDRGIPRTWRNMDGFSSHTFMWVNADGEQFWVRYHFKTDQGIEFFTQDEADRMAGTDGDYHRRDLWEAIDRGDHPTWSLQDADHAVRGGQDLPVQPIRPHEGDLPEGLPADPGRHDDAGSQPDQLPHRDRAGRVRSEQPRARHRPEPRTRCCSAGCSRTPTPTGLASGPTTTISPVNRPHATEVHSYAKDGAMRHHNPGDPVYVPNSKGGSADTARFGEPAGWHVDGDMRPRRFTPCTPRTTTGASPARWSAR